MPGNFGNPIYPTQLFQIPHQWFFTLLYVSLYTVAPWAERATGSLGRVEGRAGGTLGRAEPHSPTQPGSQPCEPHRPGAAVPTPADPGCWE